MKPAVKWTMIAGGAMTLGGPALGLLGTVIGMMMSFQSLGSSGVSDMVALSSDISFTLISTVAGIVIGILGLGILFISLIIWLITRNKPPQKEETKNGGATFPTCQQEENLP